MKRKFSFLIPLVLSTVVGQLILLRPARANWEYTKWGMTVEEVQAASDGLAIPVNNPEATSDDGQKTLLTSQWNLDRYEFEVLFNFVGSQPRLSEVVLVAESNTDGLVSELNKRFGPPTRAVGELRQTNRSRSFTLTDRDNFARPEIEPSGISSPSNEELAALVEWVTPANYIQLIRQSATDVTIRIQPTQ